MKSLTLFLSLLFISENPIFAYEQIETVKPIFEYSNWEQTESFKNLTPAINNKISLADNSDSQLVKTKYRLNSKVYYGGNLLRDLLNFVPSFDTGLFPVLYSNVYFTGMIDKKNQLNLKHKLMPLYLENFDDFRIGDTGLVEVEGGLSLRVGFISGLFNVGEKFILVGGYTITTEKIDNQHALITLKKVREIGTSEYGNITFAYFENGIFKEINSGATFKIDMTNPIGVSNYKKIIRGDLSDLTIDLSTTKLNTNKEIKNSHFYGFGAGIPFIPFINFEKYTENTNDNYSIIDLNDTGSELNLTYSLNKKDVNLFNYHAFSDLAFLMKTENKITNFQYYFINSETKSNTKKINSIKTFFKSLTNNENIFDFDIIEDENLGQIDIAFQMSFDPIIELFFQNKINSSNVNIVKEFAKSWKNKNIFIQNLNLVKRCGGNISFEISGKNISRLYKKKIFNKSSECELD